MVTVQQTEQEVRNARILKMDAGNVERQARRRQVLIQPSPQLTAGAFPHVMIEAHDETVPLEQGHEIVRRYLHVRALLPARQHFGPHQFPAVHTDARLEKGHELMLHDALDHIAFHKMLAIELAAEARVVKGMVAQIAALDGLESLARLIVELADLSVLSRFDDARAEIEAHVHLAGIAMMQGIA